MYTSCISPCCPTRQLISSPGAVCTPGMARVGQHSASQSHAWAGSPWHQVACTLLHNSPPDSVPGKHDGGHRMMCPFWWAVLWGLMWLLCGSCCFVLSLACLKWTLGCGLHALCGLTLGLGCATCTGASTSRCASLRWLIETTSVQFPMASLNVLMPILRTVKGRPHMATVVADGGCLSA